jgi:hypothetical protein
MNSHGFLDGTVGALGRRMSAFLRVGPLVVLLAAACGGSTVTDPGSASSSGGSSSGGSSSGSSSSSGGSSSSSGSSSGGVDAGPDAGYLACMDGQGTLDSSLKTCQHDGDCVIKQEEADCCGTIRFVGINASKAAAFATCEASWEAHFPGCGCASGRTTTEDGKESQPGQDGGAPQVHCAADKGLCLTFTP